MEDWNIAEIIILITILLIFFIGKHKSLEHVSTKKDVKYVNFKASQISEMRPLNLTNGNSPVKDYHTT